MNTVNSVSTVGKFIHNLEMVTLESRFNSFAKWPTKCRQTPLELASCGFYFLGVEDRVMCFYCGCGLKDWLIEDNVWLEHAIYSSKCPYLLITKYKSLGERPLETKMEHFAVSRFTYYFINEIIQEIMIMVSLQLFF